MSVLANRFRTALWAAASLGAALVLALLVLTPLDMASQAVFGFCLAGAGFLTLRLRSRHGALLVCGLALFASTRYLAWRLTSTLGFRSPAEAVLGAGLAAAEGYTWIVLVLSFFQSARPLRRPVAPLSAGGEDAPTVDVYVPSYNEPLSVVGPTVIAAMGMDYPAGRFRVYLLDDGHRPEFAAFARRVGCEYLSRADNEHAKAGNLNAAMKVTEGELICVLDCDHVPTRAFLQLTVGWFQADPKLALVQTPHFFYSPDPIQRNVKGAADMPGEGDLFYDTIQSGNDLWNATFFCGSCAVIRRAALDEVGGFAYATVTEDAHTALKIQRRGWNTSFLNIRLSAGLATETLGQHVAQRVRWCRGMTQILRIDNPLFGPGLTLAQRLCYLNALLYYQFALPRIVFLTSPLVYLFFGLNLIHAPAGMVFVYAAPHLLLGLAANHRLQGRQRRLFWGEIYETILAFHIWRPALFSLFSPKAGKFKVTDKGLRLETGYFDRRLARPHLITIGLLLAGLAFATSRLVWAPAFHESLPALLLNGAWTVFNLLMLLSAVAVAREGRQIRAKVRRPVRLPVTLYFADGRVIDAETENVSTGGLAVALPRTFEAAGREVTHVDLPTAGGHTAFPVQGVATSAHEVRVRFLDLDPPRERRLVQALMARADAWQPAPGAQARDAWGRGLTSLVEISTATLGFIGRAAWRRARAGLQAGGAAAIGGAILLALHPGDPARASESATTTRTIGLSELDGSSGRQVLALRCGAPAKGRFDLASDEVVAAARIELAGVPPGERVVLQVNGQRAAVVAASGRGELDPAVLLPGANAFSLSVAGAPCRPLSLPAGAARLVLQVAPLAPAQATKPRPAQEPAQLQPPARPHPPAPAPRDRRAADLLRQLGRQPLVLALLVVAATAILARGAGRVQERQAKARLLGLAEIGA